MKMSKKISAIVLVLAMLFTMCATAITADAAPSAERKEVVIYFANWNVYSGDNGEVKDLPWDRVSYINHAFWKIKPENGNYGIVSTDEWADTDPYNPQAHFPQYEEYCKKYPDVNVLISVGGWTCCGYFSEMALTAESRKTFIDSCIETMKEYPWVAGIDIDWEYPGVARSGGKGDEGCPVVGDDFTNYTLLLKEMREAFDAEFGAGVKKLTVCSSVGVSTIAKQDVAKFWPYVDLINIMCYDMTGSYDSVTGHHSALYSSKPNGFSTDNGVQYYLNKGVPASKINIGTPLYSHGWANVTPDANGNVVGVRGRGSNYGGDMNWKDLKKLELQAVDRGTPGWHVGYDETAQAAYLYNDDASSRYNKNFLSYESERSLQAKLDYINSLGLAGLIVWESFGDDAEADYPMISEMAYSMNVHNEEAPEAEEFNRIIVMKKAITNAYIDGAIQPTVSYGNDVYGNPIRSTAISTPNGYVLPLRYIAEKFHMTVDYLGSGKTRITDADGTYLIVNRDSTIISKYNPDGTLRRNIENTIATYTENGITYVPLRAVSEGIGLGVSYVGSGETGHGSYVVISTNKEIDEDKETVKSEIEKAYALGL